MAKAKAKTKAKPKAKPKARTVYSWKPGSRFGVKAAVAGRALEQIRQARGGTLTPAAVVEEAADASHPLHPCFDWDDTEAARKYREHQARVLVNSVRVEVVNSDRPGVAYVSVNLREGGRSYLPAAVVLSDQEYRAQALAEALASLQGWRARYRHLGELAEVFAAIDRVAARRAA